MRLKLFVGGVVLIGLPYWAALGLYIFVISGFSGPLPTEKVLRKAHRPIASSVYAVDTTLFGKLYIENRSETKIEDCPAHLIDALIATEDVRFYSHNGIDYRSLGRVFVKGFLMFSNAGGGSTITQQLAKNLYPRQDYYLFDAPIQKLREMIIARRIERVYSKDEILENYLNTVSYGEHAHGLETAARRFFNKVPVDLSHAEAATLVGILKSPTYHSPRRYPERAIERRNVVLSQMAKYGKIDNILRDSLQATPLVLDYTPEDRTSEFSGYFLAYVEKSAQALLNDLYREKGDVPDVRAAGLSIYTTIDAKLQRHAEEAIKKQMPQIQQRFNGEWGKKAEWESTEWLQAQVKELSAYRALINQGSSETEAFKQLQKQQAASVFTWNGEERKMSVIDSLVYYKRMLQTSVFSVDPHSGYVKVWIGGINHLHFPFDRVRAQRPPGSTFKPIVYAAALEAGVDPCDYYDNTKRVFEEYENWTPGNADETYGGSYSLTGSLTHSINSVAIQVLEDAGIPHTIDVARRVGIESDIPAVPSIALGTSDVRLDELTRAYCSFVNGGKNIDPVCILKITDRYGNVLYEHGPPMSIVSSVSDTIAITVLNMLEMVVNAGTAGSLKPAFGLRIPLAGKTGTSQSHADGWFMGLTPDLVTGVWVGADDPRVHFKTLAAGQGSRTAMHIYGQFLSNALKDPSFEAWKESEFYPGTKDRIRYGDCPPFSYLTAAEMESFRDMTYPEEQQPQEVSGFERFVKSIFGPRPSSPADEERLIMQEMQRELDRAVTRLKRQGKSPTEIRRRLAEIRKEYYEKTQPDENKEEI